MKNKDQIKQELHDKLLEQLVKLELKVALHRLENNNKEKDRYLLLRDRKELEVKLLEKSLLGVDY